MKKTCDWYTGCPYPGLHRLARALKALAKKAGPLGIHPRGFVASQEVQIGFNPMRAGDKHWEVTIWTVQIEGIGSVSGEDIDLVLEDLAKKIKV